MDDLDERIDALYAGPLDRFTAERDALAKDLKGDPGEAKRVKALRKPVVPAWGVNALAHEDAGAIDELLALGERLRQAQRRAISGGDADTLRDAMDERRRVVRDLTDRAVALLERAGIGGASHAGEISSTLEAATADEEAAELVRSGRLTKPLRPPSMFGGGVSALRVVRGKPADDEATAGEEDERERREEAKRLERDVAAAERAERRAGDAVDKAKERLEDLDRRRAEAKEALRAAEADLRGATMDRKRAEAALSKHRR